MVKQSRVEWYERVKGRPRAEDMFHKPEIQKSLARILYIRAIRNPGTSYVQGMNDLVTPFLAVFLSETFAGESNMNTWDVSALTPRRGRTFRSHPRQGVNRKPPLTRRRLEPRAIKCLHLLKPECAYVRTTLRTRIVTSGGGVNRQSIK